MWDCFTLVSEVPYFTSPRIADQSPAGLTRREAKLRGLDVRQQLAGWLHERYVEGRLAADRRDAVAAHRARLPRRGQGRPPRRARRRPRPTRRSPRRPRSRSSSTRCICASSTRWRASASSPRMIAAEPQQDDVLRALHDEAVAEVRTRARAPRRRRRHRGAADPRARPVPGRVAAVRAGGDARPLPPRATAPRGAPGGAVSRAGRDGALPAGRRGRRRDHPGARRRRRAHRHRPAGRRGAGRVGVRPLRVRPAEPHAHRGGPLGARADGRGPRLGRHDDRSGRPSDATCPSSRTASAR